MITKEKYLAAMDVVEGYHAQLQVTISTVEKLSEVTVREFVRNAGISTRLRNALTAFMESRREREIRLEELDRFTFCHIPNLGRSSWNEFSSKRDQYMQERPPSKNPLNGSK